MFESGPIARDGAILRPTMHHMIIPPHETGTIRIDPNSDMTYHRAVATIATYPCPFNEPIGQGIPRAPDRPPLVRNLRHHGQQPRGSDMTQPANPRPATP